MTYSLDFRKKVLKVKEREGLSFSQVSNRFDIGISTIVRWSKNILPQPSRNKPATKIDMPALKRDVEKYPDAYQYERAIRLGVSKSGIGFALKRLGVTYKKNTHSSQSLRYRTAYLPAED